MSSVKIKALVNFIDCIVQEVFLRFILQKFQTFTQYSLWSNSVVAPDNSQLDSPDLPFSSESTCFWFLSTQARPQASPFQSELWSLDYFLPAKAYQNLLQAFQGPDWANWFASISQLFSYWWYLLGLLGIIGPFNFLRGRFRCFLARCSRERGSFEWNRRGSVSYCLSLASSCSWFPQRSLLQVQNFSMLKKRLGGCACFYSRIEVQLIS